MANKDFYAILGVAKGATEDEIKKSFRRLAHEHHPDKGGDPAKFKDINEAYQVLGDKSKRQTYDQFGSAAFEQGGGGPGPGGFGGGFGGFNQGAGGFSVNMEDMGDLGEMFGEMFGFGGRGKNSGARKGADVQTEITLDFLESVKGVRKTIKLHKNDKCSKCEGSGGEPGSKSESCKTCKGQGRVQQATRTIFGTIQTAVVCSDCHGAGSKPSIPCKACNGAGVERQTKELTIDIPAGIDDSEAVRVTGAGEFPGVGGTAGDLYVRIHVKHHPTFSREGSDVISAAHVPYSTLVLGGDIAVDTVDGDGTLAIPEGTEPGTVFKIHGKGFPYTRSSGRGDHLLTVQPVVTKKLSKEQRTALEELRKAGM